MNIEVYRLAKYCMGRKIHARATHHPHKSISRYIQPRTMDYHNTTYTITSHLVKIFKNMISKHRILKYWSLHNRDIYNVLTNMSIFQYVANNLPILQLWWL